MLTYISYTFKITLIKITNMKKILFLCLIALGFVTASCSKENKVKDFQGKYTCYVENGHQTNVENMISLDSTLVIKNIKDGVKTEGMFSTTGTIIDGKLYFKQIRKEWYDYIGYPNPTWYDTSFIVTDSIFRYATIDFGEAELNGNVLKFHYIYSDNDDYHGIRTDLVCYKN